MEEPKKILEVPKKVSDVLKTIEENKDKLEFMKTGFQSVDDHLDGGFLRKELIIVGGHTGIGKSYIAGQFMVNIAKQGFKCAYFSLEISSEMVVSRLLGSYANIKPTRVVAGLLTPEEYKNLVKAKADLETLGSLMHFYDNTYELDSIVEEIKQHKYEFVVIDFIQNVFSKGEDEYTRLSRISLTLQQTAKEVDGAILVLSQLSNSAAREGSGGKVLEYKGSGNIATVSDLGFFIERKESSDGIKQEILLSLRKNRRGVSGVGFDLQFRIPGGYIYE